MVFLRPIVVRSAEESNKLSLDRYDLIRGQQREGQPPPSLVLPINEAPIAPTLRPGEPSPLATPAGAASAPARP
jgi:general secretion pathway protein D